MKRKNAKFEVSDIDSGEVYYVKSWHEGRGDTAKSAIQEAEKYDVVVTMGHTVVCPVRIFKRLHP